jgi:hypothetical protein
LQKGSSEDMRKEARKRIEIRTGPTIFLGTSASLIHDFFHVIKDGIFSQEKALFKRLDSG